MDATLRHNAQQFVSKWDFYKTMARLPANLLRDPVCWRADRCFMSNKTKLCTAATFGRHQTCKRFRCFLLVESVGFHFLRHIPFPAGEMAALNTQICVG